MRVTESMALRSFVNNAADIRTAMLEAQDKVITGKGSSKPSDDPSNVSDVLRINAEKAETEQYKRNVEFGRSRLDFTDGVLNNLEVLVERLRFLGLTSIGNSTSGDVFIAEVEGLRDQILNTMNTSFQGRFIFAGSKTNTQPYVKDSAGVATYQGDNKAVKLQVGRSAQLDTQIPGSEIFGSIDA